MQVWGIHTMPYSSKAIAKSHNKSGGERMINTLLCDGQFQPRGIYLKGEGGGADVDLARYRGDCHPSGGARRG